MLAAALATLVALAAPGKPLDGAVVVVDPGHGGQAYSKSYTGGTRGVATKQTESELNLRVGLALAELLRRRGATVFVTRTADRRLSPEGSSNSDELHARIDFFEHHNCHFFLSVHHNAGPPTATGHTALYKHNAADDALYEALARDVNDALAGAVPGPERPLIKGSYHILRETAIPGTISEAGFLTNKEFDELSSRPEFPNAEAEAIAAGAAKYWAAHKPALVALRDKLAAGRSAEPRDPARFTYAELNPATRKRTAELLAAVAPGGDYRADRVGDYVRKFKAVVATDPRATFDVTATVAGGKVVLSGTTSRRDYHDRLIDLLVAMGLVGIDNRVAVPASQK